MKQEIVIYRGNDGLSHLEVTLQDETLWMSQAQMAELFHISKSGVSEHIRHIFEDGELLEEAVVRKFRTTAADGKNYTVSYYNLDMILSLGYRVRSIVATHFRQWASKLLKEYIIKGFAMDDQRLKQLGGGNYWKELVARIRDIRSSEKVLYRQVLDLYATSADYDPGSRQSTTFFKIVQNKLHFAAHSNTAAEVIYNRVDSNLAVMGMTSFQGDHPTLRDAKIAKNYLTESELKILNNLVSGYFDLAEIQAASHKPMYMEDHINHLDRILSSTDRPLLHGSGTISHQQAMDKVEKEYELWQVKNLSPVEQAYLDTIKMLNGESKKKS